MPPYKIMIAPTLEVEERYKRLVNGREMVRGSGFGLSLKITNVGQEIFPGGTIQEFRLYEQRLAGIRRDIFFTTKEATIGKLNPEEESTLPQVTVSGLDWEGITSMTMKVVPIDDQTVQHFQNRTYPLANVWSDVFFCVNRESILIIESLDMILKALSTQRRT